MATNNLVTSLLKMPLEFLSQDFLIRILMCLFKFTLLLKLLSHSIQQKGFSLMWVLKCCLKAKFFATHRAAEWSLNLVSP